MIRRKIAQWLLGKDASGVLFGVQMGAGGDPATWDSSIQWLRGNIYRQAESMDEPYAEVGPFHRAVGVVSRDAASVPWSFHRVDAAGEPQGQPIDAHPVAELWKRPSEDMKGNQLRIGSYICKQVFGEYFWYFPDVTVGSRGGMRATSENRGELQLLHPPSVRREKMDDGTVVYKLRRKNQEDLTLDNDKLVHSRRYNPHNSLRGLSLAETILYDLIGYRAAAGWNARFFNEQNGVPTVVLKPKQGMQAEQERDKFLQVWSHRHGRKRNVGLLPGGWDIEDLGVSQRDMDFAELRQFGRDEILAAAGVPPLVAGYLTRPITYNASEQKEVYWESTIWNFLLEEQAVINFDFLPKLGVEERVFPNWDVVKSLLENLIEKTEVAAKWFQMGLSKKVINERLEMGWNEEDIEDYEQAYLPFSLAPVEFVNEPPEPSPPASNPQNGDQEDEGNKSLAAHVLDARKRLTWRQIQAQMADMERQFSSVIRSHFRGIEREVIGNLDGVKGWLAVHSKQIDEDEVLFDVEGAQRRLQRQTRPLHRRALKRGGEAIAFELAAAFDLEDPIVISKLAELTGLIVRIDETVERELREALTAGLREGDNVAQLSARVREVMEASRSRSMRIARTEVGAAFNAGRHEGMRQAGVTKHQWVSARDTSVRESHAREDGNIVPIGTPFPVTGLEYPLAPGPAEEVIQCRCVSVPIVDNLMEL